MVSSRDRGRIDEDGYLFIEGRADDTIIRGGENIAPAEIEDVLIACDGIVDAAVVGLPDDEWGQRLVAVVVGAPGEPRARLDQRIEAVRDQLRSSKTAEVIEFWFGAPPHRHRQAAPAPGRGPVQRRSTSGHRIHVAHHELGVRPAGPAFR